jgi:hypothetical protein
VSFGDVLLSESQVRTGPDGGDLSPGAGGWPTIRYFNKATGYDGAVYPKKTDKAMCDELGDEEYMEAYVTEIGGASLCAVTDGEGCTEKEKGFIEKWKGKPADDVASQASPAIILSTRAQTRSLSLLPIQLPTDVSSLARLTDHASREDDDRLDEEGPHAVGQAAPRDPQAARAPGGRARRQRHLDPSICLRRKEGRKSWRADCC